MLKKSWKLAAETTLDGLARKLDIMLDSLLPHEHSLGASITTGVKVGDLNARYRQVTFDLADTEAAFAHGLGRVPLGYIVIKTDRATNVYTSTTAWTATNMYLKSSVASAEVTLILW